MNHKITFYCAAFLSLSAIAVAQTSIPAPGINRISGFRFGFGSGYASLDSKQLEVINTRMNLNSFAPIPTEYGAYNMDLIHGIWNNTVFHSGSGLYNRNSISNDSRTTVSALAFDAGIGRVIFHSNKILLYPTIGASIGKLTVHSHQDGGVANDLSGTCPYRALDFAFTIDYIFKGLGKKEVWTDNATEKLPLSAILSITAGYTFSPFKTYWNDDNYDISNKFNKNVNYVTNVIGNTTSSNLSMFYITLKLGLGAFTH